MSTPYSSPSIDRRRAPAGARFRGRRGATRAALRFVRAWAPDLVLALAVAVTAVLSG